MSDEPFATAASDRLTAETLREAVEKVRDGFRVIYIPTPEERGDR